jgi:hypothetical protein
MSSSKYKNTPRLELKQNAWSLGSNVCIQHFNHSRFTWCCLQSSPLLFNLTGCSSCVRIDIQPQNPTAYTWTYFHIDISVADWQLQKILDIGYLPSFILHCLLKSFISFYFHPRLSVRFVAPLCLPPPTSVICLRLFFIAYLSPVFLFTFTPVFPYALLPLSAYFRHIFLPLCFRQCKPSHPSKCR